MIPYSEASIIDIEDGNEPAVSNAPTANSTMIKNSKLRMKGINMRNQAHM